MDDKRRVAEAFEGVHAGAQLKRDTLRRVLELAQAEASEVSGPSESERREAAVPTSTPPAPDAPEPGMPGRPRPDRRVFSRRGAIAAAACLAACLVGMGGWQAWATPIATISIDINPSVELEVNRLGRVTRTTGYNAEGEAIAESTRVEGLPFEQAVDLILTCPQIESALESGEEPSITIVCDDASRGESMRNAIEGETARACGARCVAIGQSEVEEAHGLGLSYGKYLVYLQALQNDPDLDVEQAKNMTMRQLREVADLPSGAGQESDGGRGAGSGNASAGTGAGRGNGSERGKGARA